MLFLKISVLLLYIILFGSCSETKVTDVDLSSSSFEDVLYLSSEDLEPVLESSSSVYENNSSFELPISSLEQPHFSSSETNLNLSSSMELLSSSMFIPHFSSSSIEPLSSSIFIPHFSSSSAFPSSSSFSVYKPGDYILGVDISKFQEYESRGVLFYDTDRQKKTIFQILKNHGINYIRLKTFVDPSAMYGYAASGCGETSSESFGDKAHIMAYAKKVKEEGFGFLLDIHYSDNWADPGKQIIPERWRSVNSIDVLSDSVYAYTYDLLSSLKSIGALPDMVQVGNEITDGLLRNVPTSETNCWGEPSSAASSTVSGRLSTQSGNFSKLIKAGIKAVHDVDSRIKTVLHIENAVEHGSWWLSVVVDQQKINFDILAFSAYTAYGHGVASDWKSFISTQSSKYPNLQFLIAEYNGGISASTWTSGKTKEINLMLKETPKAIGSFYWEPALYGEWGGAAFEWQDNNLYAIPSAFSEFDEIRILPKEPPKRQSDIRF
ncbi:MAG TPA: glycosyl hydrolase 53 family protein [Fibrobacteraceae bacterium]|nr:glycosyl hydrolase 53 family protein [Fibrobacteraceae bacterium]